MSKTIIGTIVGALILFIWGMLSWTALNLHASQNNYTANEGKILQALAENLTEGEYMIPGMPPGITSEQYSANMEANVGKPWARIQYHAQNNTNMGMNMFRGFLVNLIMVFLVIWVLLKFDNLNFKSCLLSCLVFGAVSYLGSIYGTAIWFQTNTIPDLIDAIVSWGLCGAWLGFWLNRGEN